MSTVEFANGGERTPLSPIKLRKAWLGIDENDRAVEFASSQVGAFAVCLAVIAALGLSFQLSFSALGLVSVSLLAMVALPSHRLLILSGASLFYFALRPFRIDGWSQLLRAKAEAISFLPHPLVLQFGAVGIVLALSLLFLLWQKKYSHATAAKRPVLTLCLLWGAMLLVALLTTTGSLINSIMWSVVGVSISSLWILAYSAVDAKGKDQTSTVSRAVFLRPFWGGGAAPIGKSYGYLNRFAAKSDDELAVTRLKALKLAVWALLLTAVLKIVTYVAYDVIGLTELQTAILAHANGSALPSSVNWGSLIANYLIDLLIISVWGHFIVSIVRMCGYRIPRNTVNPLASRTLAEFWNRYFFYFKELLVDFFFYPAFTKFFKKNLKLRIAFATLCAAGLGNFMYHFMRETYVFAEGDLLEKFTIFQSAAFYSLALAAGLIVSQWRGKKVAPEDGFFNYHVWPRVNVIAFFCFLKIFDDISGQGSLSERASFAVSLFGV